MIFLSFKYKNYDQENDHLKGYLIKRVTKYMTFIKNIGMSHMGNLGKQLIRTNEKMTVETSGKYKISNDFTNLIKTLFA